MSPVCGMPLISTLVKPPPPAPGMTRPVGTMLMRASLPRYITLRCITCPLSAHPTRVTGSDQTATHCNDLTKTSSCWKLGSMGSQNIMIAGVGIDISASLYH